MDLPRGFPFGLGCHKLGENALTTQALSYIEKFTIMKLFLYLFNLYVSMERAAYFQLLTLRQNNPAPLLSFLIILFILLDGLHV